MPINLGWLWYYIDLCGELSFNMNDDVLITDIHVPQIYSDEWSGNAVGFLVQPTAELLISQDQTWKM